MSPEATPAAYADRCADLVFRHFPIFRAVRINYRFNFLYILFPFTYKVLRAELTPLLRCRNLPPVRRLPERASFPRIGDGCSQPLRLHQSLESSLQEDPRRKNVAARGAELGPDVRCVSRTAGSAGEPQGAFARHAPPASVSAPLRLRGANPFSQAEPESRGRRRVRTWVSTFEIGCMRRARVRCSMPWAATAGRRS